jgi:excisionase family DNA binding protein
MERPYTVKEFSKATGVSEKTVRKACREGQVKAVKVGREWLIPRGIL